MDHVAGLSCSPSCSWLRPVLLQHNCRAMKGDHAIILLQCSDLWLGNRVVTNSFKVLDLKSPSLLISRAAEQFLILLKPVRDWPAEQRKQGWDGRTSLLPYILAALWSSCPQHRDAWRKALSVDGFWRDRLNRDKYITVSEKRLSLISPLGSKLEEGQKGYGAETQVGVSTGGKDANCHCCWCCHQKPLAAT